MNALYLILGLVLIGFGGWLIYNREKPLQVVYGLFSIFIGAVLCIGIGSGDLGDDHYQENSDSQDNYNGGSNVNFHANEWYCVEVSVDNCDGYGGSLCSCKKYKGLNIQG